MFRFDVTWRLPASPDRAYAALADVPGYRQWWPQVREVVPINETSGIVRIRSFLPYTLALRLTKEIADPSTGELRVALDGDLQGWSSFRLSPSRRGEAETVARYQQEVVVGVDWLRRIERPAEPLLRANHAWMMHSGRRGLARALAAPAQA